MIHFSRTFLALVFAMFTAHVALADGVLLTWGDWSIGRSGRSVSDNAVMTEDRAVMTPVTRIDLARFTMECLDNADCY